jgi:hypothetical protein
MLSCHSRQAPFAGGYVAVVVHQVVVVAICTSLYSSRDMDVASFSSIVCKVASGYRLHSNHVLVRVAPMERGPHGKLETNSGLTSFAFCPTWRNEFFMCKVTCVAEHRVCFFTETIIVKWARPCDIFGAICGCAKARWHLVALF